MAGLQLKNYLKAKDIKIYSDSQLEVSQIKEEDQVWGERMGLYLRKAKEELTKFKTYEILQVPRDENSNADTLAMLASSKDSESLEVSL